MKILRRRQESGNYLVLCCFCCCSASQVAEYFVLRWNFTHYCRAIDGKQLTVTYYFNYKGLSSIVMLALVDADYKFLYIDMGAIAAGSYAGNFNYCALKHKLEDKTLILP